MSFRHGVVVKFEDAAEKVEAFGAELAASIADLKVSQDLFVRFNDESGAAEYALVKGIHEKSAKDWLNKGEVDCWRLPATSRIALVVIGFKAIKSEPMPSQ